MSASDQRVLERTSGARDVGLEPRTDGCGIDASGEVSGHVGNLVRRRAPHTLGDIVCAMVIDVTDATFQSDVIEASQTTPVVVDLWAPWCGPCKTLGPILEKVVGAKGGKVVLAKVNVDENPAIAQAFRAQSIPMVVAIDKGRPVDGFTGSYPEHFVQEFVDKLLPEEASPLLVPPAEAEVVEEPFVPNDDFDAELTGLLPFVKADESKRARYLEILETIGPNDPRVAGHRKKLTAQLF